MNEKLKELLAGIEPDENNEMIAWEQNEDATFMDEMIFKDRLIHE